jgi:tRNA/rRNA methyltransferase
LERNAGSAGTDAGSLDAGAEDVGGPAIILVRPQLGENIGMVARAMLNCGLTNLRLVDPREAWPNEKAVAAASGADRVLEAATIFDSVEAAVADLQFVLATTARSRTMNKPVMDLRAAAEETWVRASSGQQCGILFGKESKGLDNEAVALADAIVMAPLNPAFSSLNLAMAVLLVGYEWRLATLAAPTSRQQLENAPTDAALATKAELQGLFDHLEAELDTCGFLRVVEKRPIMVRNLRTVLTRAQMSGSEVKTLRGVVKCLSTGHRDTSGAPDESTG